MDNDFDGGRRHGAAGGGYIPGMGSEFNRGIQQAKFQQEQDKAIAAGIRRIQRQGGSSRRMSSYDFFKLVVICLIYYGTVQAIAAFTDFVASAPVFVFIAAGAVALAFVAGVWTRWRDGVRAVIFDTIRRVIAMLFSLAVFALSAIGAGATVLAARYAQELADGRATSSDPALWAGIAICLFLFSITLGGFAGRAFWRSRWAYALGIVVALGFLGFLFAASAGQVAEPLVQDFLSETGLTL
ncbi:MAG: hypothetical protein AAGA47_05975 [Pseudomonadota bacterium]